MSTRHHYPPRLFMRPALERARDKPAPAPLVLADGATITNFAIAGDCAKCRRPIIVVSTGRTAEILTFDAPDRARHILDGESFATRHDCREDRQSPQ